ncbi:MAG: hypothetical protein FJ197_10940 [Gammaproteobacteria bacterium]|nr:hypothetical protein [Gammaproteobacteria bacterium]
MQATALDELVGYLLGLLVTAGDYALAIQPQISPDARAKPGHNAWASALTDADLSVQGWFEVALLARYPTLRFFGEEHAQSLNQRYFPRTAPLSVHLDPINATFLYRSRRANWDIIASVAEQGRLIAAVSYMPAHGRFFLATRDRGALTGNRGQPQLSAMSSLATRPGSGNCLSYQTPDLNASLAGHFACYDIVEDDDPARGLDNLNEFYSGKLDAFACRRGEHLDWGAAAYIAVAAGGVASDLDGRPLDLFERFDPEAQVDMIVASDAQTHARLMRALGR